MPKAKVKRHLKRPCHLIDLYFLDARSKLIDIAAFLDRLERDGENKDFRLKAFRKALAKLNDSKSEKAKRVLMTFSDTTSEPIPSAEMKSAVGAWKEK